MYDPFESIEGSEIPFKILYFKESNISLLRRSIPNDSTSPVLSSLASLVGSVCRSMLVFIVGNSGTNKSQTINAMYKTFQKYPLVFKKNHLFFIIRVIAMLI